MQTNRPAMNWASGKGGALSQRTGGNTSTLRPRYNLAQSLISTKTAELVLGERDRHERGRLHT